MPCKHVTLRFREINLLASNSQDYYITINNKSFLSIRKNSRMNEYSPYEEKRKSTINNLRLQNQKIVN